MSEFGKENFKVIVYRAFHPKPIVISNVKREDFTKLLFGGEPEFIRKSFKNGDSSYETLVVWDGEGRLKSTNGDPKYSLENSFFCMFDQIFGFPLFGNVMLCFPQVEECDQNIQIHLECVENSLPKDAPSFYDCFRGKDEFSSVESFMCENEHYQMGMIDNDNE